MSTTPSSQQSSRSSTAAISQQPTVLGSSATLATANACTPGSTPSASPIPVPIASNIFQGVVARYPAPAGNAGNPVSVGLASAAATTSASGNLSSATTATSPKKSGHMIRSALQRFKARLSPKNLTGFPNCTYEDLCQEMKRIQLEQEKSREMMNMFRIHTFLNTMNEFGKVLEVFLNCSDAVAFIWGPVKFLLMVSQSTLAIDTTK
jgi:hypothetical protein